jgi:hypothetical protein
MRNTNTWNQLSYADATRVARWLIFKTENTYLGKFWIAFDWKMLIFYICPFGIFTDIGEIVWLFGIFCVHLVHFCSFGIMYHKNLATLDATSFMTLCMHIHSTQAIIRDVHMYFSWLKKVIDNLETCYVLMLIRYSK